MSSTPVTDFQDHASTPDARWRVTPGQSLRHRRWSGECVLYNDLSGDTHLLGEAAIDLLLSLQANPAETAADPDELTLALLAELEALALIEAVPC